MNDYKDYKVWLSSRPGMYAQYDGAVNVRAQNDAEAIDEAFRVLKRTSFPDRTRDMWRVERVERQ